MVRAPPDSLSACSAGCFTPRTANKTLPWPYNPGGPDPALLVRFKESPALRTWSSAEAVWRGSLVGVRVLKNDYRHIVFMYVIPYELVFFMVTQSL